MVKSKSNPGPPNLINLLSEAGINVINSGEGVLVTMTLDDFDKYVTQSNEEYPDQDNKFHGINTVSNILLECCDKLKSGMGNLDMVASTMYKESDSANPFWKGQKITND